MDTTEGPIHICHDRTLPLALAEEAKRIAVQENPANEVDPNLDMNDPNLKPLERVALIAQKRWRPGKLLKIRFLDGSPTMQARVVQHAKEWTQHANIQFEFGDSEFAEIRISFYADNGSWSALGTDALVRQSFPLYQPTMNFGWLRDDTDDTEYSRVTIHEFGHALGAIHEHQNPQGGIQWNEEAVYKYFSGPPNYWSREKTYRNVIEKYSENILLGTQFDPDSIMLYAFPASLTRNGVGTTSNSKLSQLDIDFIKVAYPGRSAPGPAPTAQPEPPARSRELIGSRPNPEPDDAGMSEARGAGPTFRALLIGIDFYFPNELPNHATYASLRGCVSDVGRIEDMLHARIPKPYEIKTLLAPNVGDDEPGGPMSAWPTYANMKAAMDGLLARTQPGDHVYIHYSGHGGRVLTKFKDLKPGGYDETLVPTDIGKVETRYLRDIDLAHYLDALTTKQATVTIVLDSCHSGDATRGVDIAPRCATGAPEGVDPTLDTTERPTDGVAPDDELRAGWKRLAATGSGRLRDATATTWLPEARDYVLLAACRDVESALEARVEGRQSEGVMTTAFLEALEGLGVDQTWKALYERVLASVHSKFPSQTPQLLGQGERQVLGVELRPVVNTVRVNEVDTPNRRVKLGAGQVTGTREGARFGIYRAGTTDFTKLDKRVGAAIVDKVMAVESWASLEEGAAIASVELGAPALLEDVGSIELRRAVNLFHRGDLPPEINQDQALGAVEAKIETRGRGFLKLLTDGTPYYQVALDKDRHYEIWDPSGKPVPNVGRVAIDAPKAAEVVIDRLLHLLRYQTILDVVDPASGLKDMIRVELLTPPPEWSEDKPPQGGTVIEPRDGKYMMKPDKWMFVRVVNESNSPVNVAVIDLGDDWGIRALEPPPPDGHTIPTRRYSTVDARNEKRFALQFFLSPGRASSVDVLKIFATFGDTDFWWLLQTSIDKPVTRSLATRGEAARDALFRLREALDAEQNTLREVRARSAPGEDWTARQFHIVTQRT